MIWFLVFTFIIVAGCFAIAYATTDDTSFMNFSAWLFIAAIIFSIIQFIYDVNNENPIKELTHIQKYDLIEKCMNTPECKLEELIGNKNVRN